MRSQIDTGWPRSMSSMNMLFWLGMRMSAEAGRCLFDMHHRCRDYRSCPTCEKSPPEIRKEAGK